MTRCRHRRHTRRFVLNDFGGAAAVATDMKTIERDQALARVDEMMACNSNWAPAAPPTGGWIRAIRTALRMGTAALGTRLGVSPATVRRLEAAEAAETISLSSLRRCAEALSCELHYVLVPKQAVDNTLLEQARAVIWSQMQPVAHSMALEGQAVDSAVTQAQVEKLARRLVARGSSRDLWSI